MLITIFSPEIYLIKKKILNFYQNIFSLNICDKKKILNVDHNIFSWNTCDKKKKKSWMLITIFSPEIYVIKKKILNVDHNIFSWNICDKKKILNVDHNIFSWNTCDKKKKKSWMLITIFSPEIYVIKKKSSSIQYFLLKYVFWVSIATFSLEIYAVWNLACFS